MASPSDILNNLELITEDGVAHPIWGMRIFRHINGVGMATVRRITQKTPLQHGVLDKGFRLEPRRMTMSFVLNDQGGQQQTAVDAQREYLTYLFSPTNSPLKLRATRRDGTIRQIDCYTDGQIDYPREIDAGASQQAVVPLLAPDPTLYDPTQQTTASASLAGGSGGADILLAGYTADDWPLIDVTGPITDLTIGHFCSSSVESITLIGTIPGGETWRFDLRPGYKTLQRTSDSANRMSFVNTTTIQSFSTMRILSTKAARTHDAAATANLFQFTGTGTTGATAANVIWFKRFLSL